MTTSFFESKRNSRLKWYLDAKFGLFIHWGPYTVAGTEASWPIMAPDLSEAMFRTPSTITDSEYISLPKSFNPLNFNADSWVKTAKEAGMKYIVITTKHHDGFCMFDAPLTDYKITNTPFGRDIIKELSIACKKEKMPLGFYYSPPDMNHSGYRDTTKPIHKNWLGQPKRSEWASYLDYMESHLRKLLTDYGDVCVIWFDGLCNHAKYDTQRFHNLIHELSPNTLINDRLGDGYDFVTPEQFIPAKGIPIKSNKPPSSNSVESEKFIALIVKLFKVPIIKNWLKKQIHKYADGTLELTPIVQESYPSPSRFQPWETCMTIGQTWAYNPLEFAWKSPDTLLKNLSTVVGHGGNYLLNVGPTDLGVFPSEVVERLAYIGKWMKDNNDAIYGTSYTHLNSEPWGTSTIKDNKLFLHVFDWPTDGNLVINNFSFQSSDVSLLDGNKMLFVQTNNQLIITTPSVAPSDVVSIIVISIDYLKKELVAYSTFQPTGKTPTKYLYKNSITSASINGIINGLIALSTYKAVSNISALDGSIDVLISVAIIVFLTSWLLTSGTRGDFSKNKIALPEYFTENKKNIMSPSLLALLITLLCVVIYGGLLTALIFLVFPKGFTGWEYILFKTIYTASASALAAIISIKIVFIKNNIK